MTPEVNGRTLSVTDSTDYIAQQLQRICAQRICSTVCYVQKLLYSSSPMFMAAELIYFFWLDGITLAFHCSLSTTYLHHPGFFTETTLI